MIFDYIATHGELIGELWVIFNVLIICWAIWDNDSLCDVVDITEWIICHPIKTFKNIMHYCKLALFER